MFIKRITIAACLFLVACGSGQDSDPGAEQAPSAYEDMTFDQRFLFMNDVVLPTMRETFAAFDSRFDSMSCTTCHGSGVADGSYKMPNADIPRLPPTEEAFMEYIKDPEHGKWAQFMLDKAWPQMASLLKVKQFDPATNPNGFSCHNCHKVDGEP